MELDGGGLLSLPSPNTPLEIAHHANHGESHLRRSTWWPWLSVTGPGSAGTQPLFYLWCLHTQIYIYCFCTELPNGSLEWSLPPELSASYFALTLGSYCFPFAIIWASPQPSWVYLPISHWHVRTSVLHREPAGIHTLQPFSTPLHCCPVHSQAEFN